MIYNFLKADYNSLQDRPTETKENIKYEFEAISKCF